MRKRFFKGLVVGLKIIWPVLSALIAVIVLLGVFSALAEGWSIWDGIYYSFITALTIGYGDFAPKYFLTRILAILIGLFGVLLTGLVVAVGIQAFQYARSPEETKARLMKDE